MTMLEIIRRELKNLLANRKNLVFIFGAPLLYTLAFGLIYINGVVKDIPAVIYDANQTKLSRTLASAFEDSEKYKVVAYAASIEEMEAYIADKAAVAAIAIPGDFSEKIKSGQAAEVMVVVNGSNIIYANSVMTSASEIIQTFSAEVIKKSVEALGQTPIASVNKAVPVMLRPRILNNPTINYTNFMLIGLVTTILQQSLLLPVALAMISDRDFLRSANQSAPLHKILAGKAAVYWLLGLMSFAISIAVAHYGYGVPMKAHFVSVLLRVGVFLFAIVFAGMLFSSICPDELTATQYAMLYAVPSFLFSGYTWPRESMNAVGQVISAAFPLTYVVDDLRDLMLSGVAPHQFSNSVVLIGMGLVFFGVSLVAYRRQTEMGIIT